MLGHGFGLLGLRTVVAVTDATREPLSRTGRRYLPADARRPEQLERIAATLLGVEGWVGVIDGGSGRVEFDDRLAEQSTVVLLPFRESHEDIRTVRRDLERIPAAYAVPAQWPTNPLARDAAFRTIERLMADLRDRILPPIFSLSASKLLLEHQVPDHLPSALNAACRALAQHAALLAGIDVSDDESPIVKQRGSGDSHGKSTPSNADCVVR